MACPLPRRVRLLGMLSHKESGSRSASQSPPAGSYPSTAALRGCARSSRRDKFPPPCSRCAAPPPPAAIPPPPQLPARETPSRPVQTPPHLHQSSVTPLFGTTLFTRHSEPSKVRFSIERFLLEESLFHPRHRSVTRCLRR